ncbi:ATP-binding protein [Embleya hyalina]|uniref:LuxR family transcriptional regulator n=1 Tax=Embleya hyalina TaxID=516124 RepID=A0A401YTX4_9ACTN|nr:ATP-binding protein [Embleya hyalina]GCD98060.1 LuxR family transcriptional regulator [Embleya hyalina]
MLHGRNDELAAVTALLERTRAGDGGAVVLRGAAGTGKTTLLAEAVWAAKGMTVLRTSGPRGGGALPYTGLRQLLATLHPRIGRLPHTRAQALRTALGLAPGAADRAVVAAAACSLIAIAAREQPILVLVDDAHWLDAASAAVVTYIAARAEGLPIAVLRATREGAGAAAEGAESGTGVAGADDAAEAEFAGSDGRPSERVEAGASGGALRMGAAEWVADSGAHGAEPAAGDDLAAPRAAEPVEHTAAAESPAGPAGSPDACTDEATRPTEHPTDAESTTTHDEAARATCDAGSTSRAAAEAGRDELPEHTRQTSRAGTVGAWTSGRARDAEAGTRTGDAVRGHDGDFRTGAGDGATTAADGRRVEAAEGVEEVDGDVRPVRPTRVVGGGTDVFAASSARRTTDGSGSGAGPGANEVAGRGASGSGSGVGGRSSGRATGTDVFWGGGLEADTDADDARSTGGGTGAGSDHRSDSVRAARSGDRDHDRVTAGGSSGAAARGGDRSGAGRVASGGGPSAGLPEEARRLLALAALEPAADLDQLAVAGRRIGIGRGARLALLRADLVDTTEHRVRFRNASAREEVRRSLSAAERRSLHGALVYAASGALAYRRPWHLAALAGGPDADLAAALEAGAGRTRRELGAGAAAATWEQAARLTADRPTARRRYVAAAYAAWEAGFPVRARTLLDTADATDVEGVADEGSSAHSSGTAIRLRAALRHAEGHRSEAGALLLDAAHGRAALLLAATGAAWEAGDRARTTQARTALAALPLASDDPLRTVVAALGADGVSPAMVAPATRARLYGLGIALWEVTPLAVHAAATDQAAYEVLLDEAAVLRTHGARGALAAALMPLAVAGALSGRAVEAETHAAEGLRLARSTGQGTLAAWFLAALSMAATTQGRVAEARDGAWQALRLTGTQGLTPVGAYALYALAVVERAEGRTEAACELLATALAAPAGALMEVRIRAELATAGPNRTGLAALPPRPVHPNVPALTLAGRIPRTPQLAAGNGA